MIDYRSEIFRMKAEGVSIRKIAQQLGITPSKVQRELDKPARAAMRAESTFVGDPLTINDPELRELRLGLERERIALQRADIETRRLELEHRLKLAQGGSGSPGSELVSALLAEMRALREDRRPAQAAPSLVDQLQLYKQVGEVVQNFQSPRIPSSAVELEFTAALERVKVEERALNHRMEMEFAERREMLASQKTRDLAVANAIEQWTPVLAQAFQEWSSKQNQPAARPPLYVMPPPAPAPGQESPQTRPEQLQADEIMGGCPSCGAKLIVRPEAAQPVENCPTCGAPFTIQEGRIIAAAVPEPSGGASGFPDFG